MRRKLRLWGTGIALVLSAVSANAGRVESLLFTVGGSFSSTNAFKTNLINFINSATKTLHVAVYNLRDYDVINALNERAAAGVTVQVVTDGSNNEAGDPIKDLNSGITVKDDGSNSAEMHHKFVVVDAGEATAAVWTGSSNFTSPSFSSQNNNAVIIRDATIAGYYKDEFDRLFTSGQFHQNKGTTPSKVIMDDGTVVQVYFSPGMGVQQEYVDLINNASKSFYFAVYTYNSSTISNAMINKKSLTNYGLFESQQASSEAFTQLDELQAAGLNVATDSNPFEMHHKYLVVDAATVATGSYNFTQAGDNDNDENIVVISNNGGIAQKYIEELNRIASQSLEGLGVNDPASGDSAAPASGDTTATPATTGPVAVVSGPNPFVLGSGTPLTFYAQGAGSIKKIEVFDLSGRRIKTVFPGADATKVTWDGRNNQNVFIGAGTYYYRVWAGSEIFRGRFTAVK